MSKEEMHELDENDYFNIKQKLIRAAVLGIGRVVAGILPSFKSPLLSMSDFQEILQESYGIKYEGDLDSNGWEWDAWETVTLNNDVKVTIQGSGYYGGTSIYESDRD